MIKSEMNLETFGEIMDKFIEDYNIQLVVEIPEGSSEPSVIDNTGLGSVMQFYILLSAMEKVIPEVLRMADTDPDKYEQLIDSILELMKEDIMDVLKSGKE